MNCWLDGCRNPLTFRQEIAAHLLSRVGCGGSGASISVSISVYILCIILYIYILVHPFKNIAGWCRKVFLFQRHGHIIDIIFFVDIWASCLLCLAITGRFTFEDSLVTPTGNSSRD